MVSIEVSFPDKIKKIEYKNRRRRLGKKAQEIIDVIKKHQDKRLIDINFTDQKKAYGIYLNLKDLKRANSPSSDCYHKVYLRGNSVYIEVKK